MWLLIRDEIRVKHVSKMGHKFVDICCNIVHVGNSWWRHHMEAFSALLAICAGNSPVPGEFPVQKASDSELWCFFFYLRLNTRLRKQSWGCWFETLSRPLWGHCNAPVIIWLDPYDINWLLTAPVEMHWLSYFMIILSWLHLALADINQYVTKVANNHHTLSNARLGSVYVHIQLT